MKASFLVAVRPCFLAPRAVTNTLGTWLLYAVHVSLCVQPNYHKPIFLPTMTGDGGSILKKMLMPWGWLLGLPHYNLGY